MRASDLRHAAAHLCPGFIPAGSPLHTATSMLQPGLLHGRPVIAKAPTDPRPWWRARCRHEIAVYQALAATRPPVTVPELVAAEPCVPLLIMTRLPGTPLHPDRYIPPEGVPPAALHRLLTALTALHTWRPDPRSAIPHDHHDADQLVPFVGDLLTTEDLSRLTALQLRADTPAEVSHGDAHLGNTLATDDQVALVDLELTAWRPAGYDHAKLWIFSRADPAARATVLADIGADLAAQAGFWSAVVLVAVREIVSHRRHHDLPQRAARLTALAVDLQHALAVATDLLDRT